MDEWYVSNLVCPRDHLNLKRVKDVLPDLYLESLAIGEEEKQGLIKLALKGKNRLATVVAYLIDQTNGNMYRHLIGNLESYPIPDLRLPDGNGQTFLELGCSWGRWSIAAARKGFSVVGIDPSLGAVMAPRRVSK